MKKKGKKVKTGKWEQRKEAKIKILKNSKKINRKY